MKKVKWLGGVILLFLAVFTGLFVACQNEEEDIGRAKFGLDVGVDLLKLNDDSTNVAGRLEIRTGSPEINIKWNTDSICNLDTTLSKISVKDGVCTLPVKWKEKLSDGKYGPNGIAYKAGVQITSGEITKYIPLIWAEKVDTTKVMESTPVTRAVGDPMPRVSQITMIPSTVNLNDELGGSMYIGLSSVAFAILDWSEITSDMNIDISPKVNSITESTMFNFTWKNGAAPTFEFSAKVTAMSEGLTQTGIVQYMKAPAPPATLEVNPSSHTISAAGQTVSSSITSSTNWTASSNVAWINPVVISSTELNFIVAPNTTSNVRTGTVTISAGSASRTVTFAQQGAQQFYRVYYNTDGGTPTPTDNNVYSVGATVYAASAISKYGYTFTGWRRSDNGAVIAANSAFVMLATDVTLTAQWTSTKSSFKGTVINCSNIKVTGGGRWIVAKNAVYGEYRAIEAKFTNIQIAGSKFSQIGDGTVVIQPGKYLVKFNGSFGLGAGAAGGAVYLASARDIYFRTGYSAALPVCAYFKWHQGSNGGAVTVNGFSNQGAIVTISIATTIRCDAQIVGQNRPWGWTAGWLTVSGMEITEL